MRVIATASKLDLRATMRAGSRETETSNKHRPVVASSNASNAYFLHAGVPLAAM